MARQNAAALRGPKPTPAEERMPPDLLPATELSSPPVEMYRLSLQQRLAWRLHEASPLPNAQIILRIPGSVEAGEIRAAEEAVRVRHEILRTGYHRVPG